MAKFQAPNLENVTDGAIIDELAKLGLVENYAKGMRKFYREALFARKGIKTEEPLPENSSFEGETFVVSVSRHDETRISADKVKEAFPETWADLYANHNTVTTVRSTLKPGVVNPNVEDLITTLKRELDLE